MTAKMPSKHRMPKTEASHDSLMLGFMETVKLNFNLEIKYMPWANVKQTDESGYTALYWAIRHGNLHNVKVLLAYGSTLQVSPALTAPFCAVAYDQLGVLRYFLEKGLDPDIRNNGETLLAFACKLGRTQICSELRGYLVPEFCS